MFQRCCARSMVIINISDRFPCWKPVRRFFINQDILHSHNLMARKRLKSSVMCSGRGGRINLEGQFRSSLAMRLKRKVEDNVRGLDRRYWVLTALTIFTISHSRLEARCPQL
ncbi:hypothetical protein AM1_D0205 (plasmid) [Acaryochloris marina MBIC11017]|uniref:Uncharacterized protein n=1 Tax=Acaryochloris marina (strain MBIC 11017) TaxID=329726 RepID=A8ZNW4_ACAM1|nr:hypothetical protein AM1_D0205 [Acaryochloris marina MBIC11017]